MPGHSRENLVNLVLHGNKRATAGLLAEYEHEEEPVEHVGELLAMVDNNGHHVTDDTLIVTVYFDLLPEITRTSGR